MDDIKIKMEDYESFGLCGSSVAYRSSFNHLFNKAGCDSTDMNAAIPILAETYGLDRRDAEVAFRKELVRNSRIIRSTTRRALA